MGASKQMSKNTHPPKSTLLLHKLTQATFCGKPPKRKLPLQWWFFWGSTLICGAKRGAKRGATPSEERDSNLRKAPIWLRPLEKNRNKSRSDRFPLKPTETKTKNMDFSKWKRKSLRHGQLSLVRAPGAREFEALKPPNPRSFSGEVRQGSGCMKYTDRTLPLVFWWVPFLYAAEKSKTCFKWASKMHPLRSPGRIKIPTFFCGLF